MNQLKVLIKIMMLQDWGINGFSNKIEESMEKRKLKSILMMIVFMMFEIKNNTYSVIVGFIVLYLSVRSSWLIIV